MELFLKLCIFVLSRRYKKQYKVPVRQGLNKAQLADVSFKKNNLILYIF